MVECVYIGPDLGSALVGEGVLQATEDLCHDLVDAGQDFLFDTAATTQTTA